MRLSILALGFLLISRLATAQYYPIRLADDDATLDIPASFNVVEVVDLRKDTLSVGFVEAGTITSRLYVANLEGGAALAIKHYIHDVLPQRPDLEPMAMVIRELRVYEDIISQRSLARLHVSYEFYRIQNKDVSLALSFRRDYYDTKGGDVTTKHETNVRQSIREALEELSRSDKDLTDASTSGGYITGGYAMLTAAKPVRGIYRSLEEFRDNAPSIQRDFELCQKSRVRALLRMPTNELYYLDEKGKRVRPDEPVWGFCDGEKVYIRRSHGYVELARGPEQPEHSSGYSGHGRNTYTFQAYTSRSRKSYTLVGSIIGNTPQLARYQLDIENGLTYQIR